MQWLYVFYASMIALLMNGVMSEHVPSLQMSDMLNTNRTMDNCVYCEVFTTLIQVAMQKDQQDIDQIRLYADIVCGMLGNQSLCHQYVDKLDLVIDGLKKGESSHNICKELKFCTTQETIPMYNMTVWNQSSITIDNCFFCTQVASLLKVAMAQNPDQINEIRQIADLICNILPKTNKCHKVMENIDQIIDLLHKGEEPIAVCRYMHICPKNESLIHLVLVRNGESTANNTCMYCSGVLTVLEIALKQKPDQIQVAREMAGIVCDMLPATDQCHGDLKMFDTALSELKAGKGPHAICTELHFFTKVEETESALVTPELAMVEDVNRTDKPCMYCEIFTTLIEVAMQKDKTEMDEIREYADMICGMLGDQNLCHQYADKLDFVVDALKKGESTHKICEEMKFCVKIGKTEKIFPSPIENSDCAYCTGVLVVLEIALKQKPDQVQAARDAAGIVCDLLPADDKCHTDLKMFDMVVSKLKSGKGPHEICKDLNVCSATMNMTRVPIQSLDLSQDSDPVCTQCNQNLLLWASVVTSPDSLKTFEYAVGSICPLIPNFIECELLMKHHDVIVNALHQGQDMNTICTRIHSCTDSAPNLVTTIDETTDVSMGCLLCEYTAEVLIHTNKNMEELRLAKKALETMCFILPPSARCDVLSAKFDQLVALVQAGKNANEACGVVTLCSVQQETKEEEQKTVMSIGNLLEME